MNRKMTFGALAGFMFIALAIVLPSMSSAKKGKWTTKADMATARYGYQPFVLGTVHWSTHFSGLIDDVRIYSYALSAEEVKMLCDGKEPLRKKEPWKVHRETAIVQIDPAMLIDHVADLAEVSLA